MKTNDYALYPATKNAVGLETENGPGVPIGYGGCVVPPAPSGTIAVPPPPGDAELERRIRWLARKLASRSTPLFKVVTGPDDTDRLELTQMGWHLATLCCDFDRTLMLRHRRGAFDPYFKLMCVALCHWCEAVDFRACTDGRYVTPTACAILDRIARLVRRVSASPVFQARLKAAKQRSGRNLRRASSKVALLFRQHPALLFAKVELHFWGRGTNWADEHAAACSFEHLMRGLCSGSVAAGVLAVVGRCDEGPARTICFQLLVIANGRQRADADALAKTVGAAWVARYSSGLGSFFNCSLRIAGYRCKGVGVVRAADWRRLAEVRSTLRELTKPWGSVAVRGVPRRGCQRTSANQRDIRHAVARARECDLPVVLRILGVI